MSRVVITVPGDADTQCAPNQGMFSFADPGMIAEMCDLENERDAVFKKIRELQTKNGAT